MLLRASPFPRGTALGKFALARRQRQHARARALPELGEPRECGAQFTCYVPLTRAIPHPAYGFQCRASNALIAGVCKRKSSSS